MKHIFFMPYGIKRKHFERGLENLQVSIDDGNDVLVINCNKQLLSCMFNFQNDYIKCLECVSRKKMGLSLFDKGIQTINLPELSRDELNQISTYLDYNIKDVSALKKERFQQFDIGYAVSSAIITLLKTPYPNLIKNREFLNNLLWSSAKTFLAMKKVIIKAKPDKVFLHNGREAIGRAVVRACESLEVEYTSYEAGFNIYKYNRYENAMPQNIKNRENQILQNWNLEPDFKKKKSIAETYFYNQRQGKNAPAEHLNFVKNQTKNLLPDNWNQSKKNVVIFNSTENEFAAIDDTWTLPFYENQMQGILKISESLENEKENIKLYLRVHPNFHKTKDPSIKQIESLDKTNINIIPPNSAVSTYKLIEKSDIVITFVSTIGCESSFWGKPTILLGNPIYKNLGGFHIPKSHNDCIKMICSDLKTLKNIGALKYGYYRMNFGRSYKYYIPIDNMNGTFRGKVVRANKFIVFLNKKRWKKRFKLFFKPLEIFHRIFLKHRYQ